MRDMASVFVSYAREDAAKARALASALGQASIELWFDERLQSGSEYSREIEDALKQASAVLVLWSKHSIDSAWVRDEAAEGRDSGRLIPLSLDESRPPIGFRQFQTTDLSRWNGRGRPRQLDDIIAAIRVKSGQAHSAGAKPEVARSRLLPRRTGLIVLALGIALLAAAGLFVATRGNKPPQTLSVALLPFTANSADPNLRKLAIDTHDAVAHTLSQGAFELKLIDSLPADGRPPADFVLSGQLSSESGKILATIRMDETAHHSVVFSDQFDSNPDKIGGFAERVGAQVAAQLSWTAPLIAIDRKHPSDPAITAALLQSRSAISQDSSAIQDYQASRRIALKAPNSAIAQMSLGFNTGFALEQIPLSERADAVMAARRSTERARELAPEFGEPYIPWCLLHSPVRMAECEDRLRIAMRVDPDAPFPHFFLSMWLNNAGRTAEAAQMAGLSHAHDPFMPLKIALMLRMLEATGQSDEAARLFEQSKAWWPDNGPINWFRMTGMAQRGDFAAVLKFQKEIDPQARPDAAVSAIVANSLSGARKACSSKAEHFTDVMCMLGLARLGDLDRAYAIADRLYPPRLGPDEATEERMWLQDPAPTATFYITSAAATPLRRDLRYVALAERVGLLRYWRNGRPPDFCRTRPEPICSQLLPRH
jgi:TolB-like protein